MSRLIQVLQKIEQHPGFYLRGRQYCTIRILEALITGFHLGDQSSESSDDLKGYTEWVATHYHVLADGNNGFSLILEHENGDESKAFDEFFKLLPIFLRDQEQWGFEGIISRFLKVQEECREEFWKKLRDENGQQGPGGNQSR